MAYENLKLRKKLYNFSGGYATQDEPERIEDTQSPDMLNVRPLGYGAYAVRNGITRVGDDDGVGSVRSLYTFTQLENEILVRSKSTTLEFLDDDTWETVPGIPTYTDNQKFGFANDETYLYGSNGVESFFQWDGKNIGDTVFTTDHTINTFTSTAHGLSIGSIIYVKSSTALPFGMAEGTPYYVINDGFTANTFKVSETSGGSALNITDNGTGTHEFFSGIVQISANPKGRIMEFFLRRLFVSGIPAEPAKVYYSDIQNPTDFSGGESGAFVVGEGGDEITSLKVFTSPTSGEVVLFVFKKSSRIYMITFDSAGLLTIKEARRNTGAINHESTVMVENDLMYIDVGNNIINIGYRENITNDLRTESTSVGIDRTTNAIDFQQACGVYWKKRRMLFMTGKSFGATNNDTTLVYFYDFKSWWKWGGIYANEFAIYGNEVMWASSVDGNVYKYDEDSFSDLEDEGTIMSYRGTKDMEFENRDNAAYIDMYKQARFVIVRGYISPGATMTIKVAYNGKVDQPQKTITFTGTDENIVEQDSSVSFVNNVFGEQVFGGYPTSTSKFPMREFLCVLSLEQYSFLRMRVTPEVEGAGSPYIIKAISVWAELQEDEKFPINKKL